MKRNMRKVILFIASVFMCLLGNNTRVDAEYEVKSDVNQYVNSDYLFEDESYTIRDYHKIIGTNGNLYSNENIIYIVIQLDC